MRTNRSNLIIVMLLIAIFSIQTFSISAPAQGQQPNKNSSLDNLSNVKSQNMISHNQVVASSLTDNLRNLSMSDLFSYMQYSASQSSNSFVDSSKDHLDTTVTVARGLAILKILGFTNYIIPTSNRIAIFKNFGSPINNGYAIQNSTNIPSIMGTYGVVQSAQLLNLNLNLKSLKDNVISFLLSKYQNTTTMGGFKENFQTDVMASIQSTYYAVLIFKTLGVQFNQTQKTQIESFLNSLWDTTGHYFQNTNDPDQSTFLTSLEAISILYSLGSTGSLWNSVKSGYPQYVNSHQDKLGVFTGSIHQSNSVANVDDTGNALSALHILNKTSDINVTSAVQFILQSQYNGTAFPNDIGGFTKNNSTQSETSQYSGVTLTHTYYAILGLYSSGYLTNHTQLSFETQYSSQSHLNNLKNEILTGQNSTLNAQINTFGFKNYYGEINVNFKIDNISVYYVKTDNNNSVVGSQYIFNISTIGSNFQLGSHNLVASYSLSNFSLVPTFDSVYHSTINVRFPITSKINGISTSFEVSPGDLLSGEIDFDNIMVNNTNVNYSVLGNVSVSLVYPNGTTSNTLNNFSLSLNNQTYLYNVTLPKNSVLGDYMINLTYTNNSQVLFYTEQVFTVTTSVYFIGLTSSTNYNIYGGSNFNLTIRLAYQNGLISPLVSDVTAKFIESKTQQEKFTAPMEYVSGNVFKVKNSYKVPIGLYFGTYNVSIVMHWNSSITGNSLPMTSSNSTLKLISYQGNPVIQNIKISPISERSNENNLFSGDFFNLSADIGVFNSQTKQVYLLNSSTDVSAYLFNTSNSKQNLQELSFDYLNNSKISVFGYLNPNMNILNDVKLTLSIKIRYASSNTYNLLYTYNGNSLTEYKPNFILKKANIKLDDSTVNFVIGSSNITQNQYTTLLVTFKIFSTDNSQYVTGLKLNASLTSQDTGKQIVLPAVTALEANNSYQVQIPVNTLNAGNYKIGISTLNTNYPLGNISLTIAPVIRNNSIPFENYLGLGTVSIAVLLTILGYSIRKKK